VKRRNCLLPEGLPKTQVELDQAYRKRQADKGIVRKTVLVPESKLAELHAICRKWRAEDVADDMYSFYR
jgi:hypothetical protein